MKKTIENKTDRSNKRWSQEEVQFIQLYYGAVKTDCIALALERSAISVWQQCKTRGFKLNPRIYQTEQLEVLFNGKTHKLQCFQYSRNEKGHVVDKTVVRKKIGRPRKYKLNIETKTAEPMSAHRRKPELKEKKRNLKEQSEIVQEFTPPADKKLTWIPEKRAWLYR